MPRPRTRFALALTTCAVPLLTLAYACAPANQAPQNVPTVVGSTVTAPPAPKFASPAHWALSPSSRWQPSGSLTLPAGTLWYGAGGERWLEGAKGLESADTILPETIAGAQVDGTTIRFVGASGAVYLAKEPLGSFTLLGKGVEHARVVTVGKSCIVAVDANGDLMRTTDAKTWTKIEIAGREGPIVDIALGNNGGLLSTAPLHLYASKDDGVTWAPIKPPPDGVTNIRNDLGTVVVDGRNDTYQLDPSYGTFTQYVRQGRSPHGPRWPDGAQLFPWRRADGKRVLQIGYDGKNQRSFTVAVFDFGQPPAPKHLDQLDGCDRVNGAIRGETVVLACDARGSVQGGIDKDAGGTVRGPYGRSSGGSPDGGSLGFITKLYRSDDGGQSWKEDTTVEGGIPANGEEPIAISDGGWVFLGQRCGQSYSAQCLPARVRGAFGAPFAEVASDTDSKWVRFATSSTSSTIFAIQNVDDDARLMRFKAGATTPEDLGSVGQSTDFAAATLSQDDDGTVRGFVRRSDKRAGFTFKDGAGIGTVNLPPEVNRVALAGIHGLAQSSTTPTEGWETVDGGKTWGKVALPQFVGDVDFCNDRGCLLDRGVRAGWDAPSAATDAASAKTEKVAYMKPLRCSAKDRWTAVGGGWYPNVDGVDHGVNRWVMPTRAADGTIALAVNKRGDPATKTTSVAMMGPAPGPPKFGSGTTMHMQPGGVVVLRYSYPRERKGPGRYNPVDASVAWWRDGTGKVLRGAVGKNPPFRVNKDPTGETGPTPPYRTIPEVLSLGEKGVYFRPLVYDGDEDYDDNGNPKPKVTTPIYFLKDDGRTDKLKFPTDPDGDDARVVTVDGAATLVSRSSETWNMYFLNEGKTLSWTIMGGMNEDEAPVSVATLGGKPIFVATTRAPSRAFGIGFKNDTELPASVALATQRLLGDAPKPCDGAPTNDPGTVVFDAPWTNGTRRPVIVDIDGVGHILSTGRAKVRQGQNPRDACVSAFEANDDDVGADGDFQFGALVFPDDLAHSLIFQAKTGDWPAIVNVRPMECAYTAGPLPKELEGVDGFQE